jgi:hypothetical protein
MMMTLSSLAGDGAAKLCHEGVAQIVDRQGAAINR